MSGKQKLNTQAIVRTTLVCLLLSLLPFSHTYAQEQNRIQEEEGSNPSETSWADKWIGFKVEFTMNDLGVEMKVPNTNSQKNYVSPQIGGGMLFGIILDKQSKDPMTLLVGWSKAKNRDQNGTNENISTTSFLDIGLEYPLHYFINNKKDKLGFDIAGFASSCRVSFSDSESVQKWGISTRLSLSYHHRLQKGLQIGCRLYNKCGNYFGSKTGSNDRTPSFTNEFGLALCLSY